MMARVSVLLAEQGKVDSRNTGTEESTTKYEDRNSW